MVAGDNEIAEATETVRFPIWAGGRVAQSCEGLRLRGRDLMEGFWIGWPEDDDVAAAYEAHIAPAGIELSRIQGPWPTSLSRRGVPGRRRFESASAPRCSGSTGPARAAFAWGRRARRKLVREGIRSESGRWG